MDFEANVLLLSGIVGLVVGILICVATGDRAFLIHITSAFLGAFVGGYLSGTIESAPMTGASVKIGSATVGAIALALLVNRILRE
jgi:uncharacterized membrane protein YeaQ/YmgE (transglycosylase-associated protein family)